MKNQFNRLTAIGLVAICAGLLSTVAVRAQNPPAPLTAPAPQPQWETLASAGLTLTKGNSDTMLANLGVTTTKKWTANEISSSLKKSLTD